MEKLKEYSTVYAVGSLGYSLIEVLWRGFTHWTMALTGGVSFLCLYFIDIRLKGKKLLYKCFAGSAVITLVEFCVGCVVNMGLHMSVWDYSKMPGNLLGQVCPLYSFLWFLLCFPVIAVGRLLRRVYRPGKKENKSVSYFPVKQDAG